MTKRKICRKLEKKISEICKKITVGQKSQQAVWKMKLGTCEQKLGKVNAREKLKDRFRISTIQLKDVAWKKKAIK